MRTESDYIKINEWLLPLSWLYGLGVNLRNRLFDMGILKETPFDIPVISVGNITVGGTGKTPHVEYLIRLLKDISHVGVLSRGYKRKTKGFILATHTDSATSIGDEPYQMKKKFPNVTVAVDKDRRHGIEMLSESNDGKKIEVILLDDAYQHRYVKPGINILLVDYHRFIMNDKLLPAGRLREPISGKDRADMVIVTKCPTDLKPMEFRLLTKNMNLYPFQSLYFTSIEYGKLYSLFNDDEVCLSSLAKKHVLLLTGIAFPAQMKTDIQPKCKHLSQLVFDDHHQFTAKDIDKINKKFAEIPGEKLIITTEKDATRLTKIELLSDEVKKNIYYLPIKIKFLLGTEEEFNQKIISYVQKNSRDSILVKEKNDH